MKGFVINLEKDKDRLRQFYSVFSNSTYNIERILGVYGKYVKDEDVSFLCKHLCTDSMKGCSASHMNIWKKIITENISESIIFEDDAFPLYDDYESKIKEILSEVPKDFDIINLTNTGYHTDVNPIFELLLRVLGVYNNNNKIISENICIPKFTTTTSAYIISIEGVRKILKLLPKITGHIDSSIFTQYKNFNIYAIRNNIFTQKYEDSNNGEHKSFLSYLIPNFYLKNGFRINQILYTDNFKLFGKNICLSYILCIIILLVIFCIFFKKWSILLYGTLAIIILYIIILRLTFTT